MTFINIADLVCPDDPEGRTYRQINAAKAHSIPIGALVEMPNGCRLFVVHHGRDCDRTPLYYLSPDPDDTEQVIPKLLNRGWSGGWPEESLRVIAAHPEPTPEADDA